MLISNDYYFWDFVVLIISIDLMNYYKYFLHQIFIISLPCTNSFKGDRNSFHSKVFVTVPYNFHFKQSIFFLWNYPWILNWQFWLSWKKTTMRHPLPTVFIMFILPFSLLKGTSLISKSSKTKRQFTANLMHQLL